MAAALAGMLSGVVATTYYSRLAAAVAAAIGRRDAASVRTRSARTLPWHSQCIRSLRSTRALEQCWSCVTERHLMLRSGRGG